MQINIEARSPAEGAAILAKLQEALRLTAKESAELAQGMAQATLDHLAQTAQEKGIPTTEPLSEITVELKGHERYGYDSGGLWAGARVFTRIAEDGAEALAVGTGLTRGRYNTPGIPRTSPQRNPLPYDKLPVLLEGGHTYRWPETIRMFRYLAVMLEAAPHVGIVLPKPEPGEERQGTIVLPARPLCPEPTAVEVGELLGEMLAKTLTTRVLQALL